MSNRLAGRGVVITRPAHQAAPLGRLIEGQGGRAILFPAIEILDVESPALDALIDRLEAFDIAIFISPNAVTRGLATIRRRRALPEGLTVAAIGGGSARELRRQGVAEVVAPTAGADSEALLAAPELQAIGGKRIVIFRGAGGRELLHDELRSRGAAVEYAECYRRRRPQTDPAALLAAWGRGDIDAAVATSSEGLRNFAEMIGPRGRAHLATTMLFVPHPRIAATARELSLDRLVVTGPGEEGIVEGLARHFG